jgi:hypothetical protein
LAIYAVRLKFNLKLLKKLKGKIIEDSQTGIRKLSFSVLIRQAAFSAATTKENN